MSCARTRQMLDAWLDGELDANTAGEMAAHIGGCADCLARREERQQLRTLMRAQAPRFAAPAALRQAVRAAAATTAPPEPTRALRWWHVLGGSLLAAACSALVTAVVLRGGTDLRQDNSADQIVARHVASLARPSPVDVQSTDRHVIKPWFHGKVDFAPAVRDLSGQGIALLGARLDQINADRAVAVVYKVRQHPINLFVWRSAADPVAPQVATVRGFSLVTWVAGGLAYAAIADIEPGELERFARQVASPPP